MSMKKYSIGGFLKHMAEITLLLSASCDLQIGQLFVGLHKK